MPLVKNPEGRLDDLHVDGDGNLRTLPGAISAAPKTGEIAGAIASTPLPNVACRMVRLKARNANTGKVYLGPAAGVTKPDGATDATTGYELAAGDETGFLPIDNLNRFGIICDNASDGLTYLALV